MTEKRRKKGIIRSHRNGLFVTFNPSQIEKEKPQMGVRKKSKGKGKEEVNRYAEFDRIRRLNRKRCRYCSSCGGCGRY